MTASAERRVLIVDDDQQVRRLLERLLERNGYDCSLAADVGEAARLLAAGSFAVVLCDVKMPGGSGFSLLRAVRVEHPGTASVLISGLDMPELRGIAEEFGARGFLSKPFGEEHLLSVLDAALADSYKEPSISSIR